jgi:hypothetical protein
MKRLVGESSEIPDLLRIPRPLQEKFYAAALEEAQTLSKQIADFSSTVEEISRMIGGGVYVVKASDEWRDFKIGVVDGSDVPAVNDRIGLRYGLYSVAYKLFKGLDPVDDGEWFYGDRLSGKISMQRESFLKILDLLTTYYERYAARNILNQVDLVMVDGSFFGYRAGCSMVKEEELNWTDGLTNTAFKTVFDLISRINDLTVELVESGKAFGVIKRVSTMALDGYMCYLYGPQRGVTLSDRSVLGMLMKPGEVFDYENVFGQNLRFDVLTWYRKTYMDSSIKRKEPEVILRKAENRVFLQLVADLTPHRPGRGGWKSYENAPVVRVARSTKRVFVKTVEDIPPICVEFSSTMPDRLRELVLSYVYGTANPATGLPLALDLVDDLVSLPRGVCREFVNEIEAEMLRRGFSRESLLAVFSRYNPQKEEG